MFRLVFCHWALPDIVSFRIPAAATEIIRRISAKLGTICRIDIYTFKLPTMKKITVLSSILTLLALTGCGPSETGGGSDVEEVQASASPVVLEGTSWQLVKITALGGYEFLPEDGSDYILRFRSQSRLVIESDCNTAGATWTQEGGNLILEQFVTTNNMCPPGTLHNHFVSNMRNVEAFSDNGGNLVFATSIPGVTLEFESR